jgi:hypothetical protein
LRVRTNLLCLLAFHLALAGQQLDRVLVLHCALLQHRLQKPALTDTQTMAQCSYAPEEGEGCTRTWHQLKSMV